MNHRAIIHRGLIRLTAVFGLSGLLTLLPLTALALELPPNFDARIDPARKPTVSQTPTDATADLSRPDGFLTAPRTARPAGPVVEHAVTRDFLDAHRTRFGHGAELLDTAKVARDSTGAHNGLRSVVWVQQQRGLEVFGGRLASHTMADGRLLRVTGGFIAGVTNSSASTVPTLTAAQAIALAAQNISENIAATDIQVAEPSAPGDVSQKQTLRAASLKGDAWARLLWLPVDKSTLRLCWQVEWMSRARKQMFRTLVDATDGKVWLRHNLTSDISPATYNVFVTESPTPMSPGWPVSTINTQPAQTNRVLVTLSALDTNASPNGWINDGVFQTLGNNVDAHTDTDGNDVADLPRPQATTNRVFDFPMSLAQNPSTYASASVVQLFYLNNWVHDKLYQLGFTEAAGNFQTTNFGRGGLGNDAVQADTQDGSDSNNADFSTPSDGSAPRMQMYVFTFPSPQRDSTFDSHVVTHEYCHGLSGRLVGGGAGISGYQTAGMGEGWSDFYALCLWTDPASDPDAVYPMGAYTSYKLGSTAYQNNYYFGIRAYPYTTDMAKNPFTLGDIDPNLASLHPGIPRNTYSGSSSATELHSMGSVWCTILWEMRANLVRKLGGPAGNQLALQLVTDGMKLSPVNPVYSQARDAILAAELADCGGTNRLEVWSAFAKRGLGYGAYDSPDFFTVVESYDVADALQLRPFNRFETIGPVGGPFANNTATYTLTNNGNTPLNWTTSIPTNWLTISPASGTLAAGATTNVTVTPTAAANSLPNGTYTSTFYFTNLATTAAQPRTFRLGVGIQDYFAEWFDGISRVNDLSFSQYTFKPLGTTNYTVCREVPTGFPTDPTGGTSLTLGDDAAVNITLSGTNTVTLYGGSTNVVTIGSNGYLSWGGDTANDISFANHFNRRRISLLLRDLDPSASASAKISWKQLPDRLAVTYQAVPEFDNPSLTNSFQAELFFNGYIRLTYLALKSTDGIAGLSAGNGVPTDLLQTDLTKLGLCQLAPLLTGQPTNRVVGVGSSVYFNTLVGLGTAPLTFQWNRNGSPTVYTNQNLTNPTVQLSDAGSYTLVVSNPYGSVTSAIASLTVTSPPPVAAFTALPTNAYVSAPVTFSNTSSSATNFFWDFGDGNFDLAANTLHAYAATGTYTVSLSAAGPGGVRTLTRADYIVVTDTPSLAAPQRNGSNFQFAFPTLNQHTYTVQYKDALTNPAWLDLLPATNGTGGNVTFTNTPPGPQRYYRLLTQ